MKNKKLLKLFITTLIVIGTGTSFFRMNEIKAEESNLSVKCVDQKNILQNNIKVNLIKEELIMSIEDIEEITRKIESEKIKEKPPQENLKYYNKLVYLGQMIDVSGPFTNLDDYNSLINGQNYIDNNYSGASGVNENYNYDGKLSYVYGHNPGPFAIFTNLKYNDIVGVWDANGEYSEYIMTKKTELITEEAPDGTAFIINGPNTSSNTEIINILGYPGQDSLFYSVL